jgi:hypothetical protein
MEEGRLRVGMLCHLDRSEAEWRDDNFYGQNSKMTNI